MTVNNLTIKSFRHRAICVLCVFAVLLMSNRTPQIDGNRSSCNSSIIWSFKRPLRFTDFEQRPLKRPLFSAHTCYEIRMKIIQENDIVSNVFVSAVFIPCKSFMVSDDSALLNHEQVHFDIAELYARHLRRDCISLVERGKCKAEEIQSLYDRLVAESDSISEAYDRVTRHGTATYEQFDWKREIGKKLSNLDRFQVVSSASPK